MPTMTTASDSDCISAEANDNTMPRLAVSSLATSKTKSPPCRGRDRRVKYAIGQTRSQSNVHHLGWPSDFAAAMVEDISR